MWGQHLGQYLRGPWLQSLAGRNFGSRSPQFLQDWHIVGAHKHSLLCLRSAQGECHHNGSALAAVLVTCLSHWHEVISYLFVRRTDVLKSKSTIPRFCIQAFARSRNSLFCFCIENQGRLRTMNPRLKELVRLCIKMTLVEPPPFASLPLLSAHLFKYHYKPMQQVLPL